MGILKSSLGLGFMVAVFSGSALAIPENPKVLIRAVMDHPELTNLLDGYAVISGMSFDMVDRYDFAEECDNYSRSGSIIQVTIKTTYPEVQEKVHLFSTPGAAEKLVLCR